MPDNAWAVTGHLSKVTEDAAQIIENMGWIRGAQEQQNAAAACIWLQSLMDNGHSIARAAGDALRWLAEEMERRAGEAKDEEAPDDE